MADNETPVDNKVDLQLQDIIQIDAPDNEILNDKQFVITYIAIDKIKLCNVETLDYTTLIIDEDGNLHDDSIESINLISRANSDSFAIQNNLIPDKWIDIHFGGDVPEVITGEITSLENDMIEIRLFPNNEIIYIDFAYKGIPEDLPINKINVRAPPESVRSATDIPSLEERVDEDRATTGVPIEEMELFPEEVVDSSTDIKERIREFFIADDDISFGEDLEEIVQEVRVDEDKIRFSVENQTNDLLNDMLSTIPNNNRTQSVLSSLHKMIERYRQVRRMYSDFDNYGNALMPKIKTADHKPLIQYLKEFNRKLYWVLPIVKNTKKLYDISSEEVIAYSDVMSLTLAEQRFKEESAVNSFYSTSSVDSTENNKYIHLLKELNPLLQKHTDPFSQEDLLILKETNDNIITLVDNLGDYYSSISKNDNIKRRKFLLDTYTTSLQILETIKTKGGDFNAIRKKIIPNSILPIKSLLFMNEGVVRYSRINLPGTNILTRANLNTFPFYYFDILNKNSVVQTVTIDSFEDKLSYDNFLDNLTEYVLDDTIQAGDKYDKYLEKVIPRTKNLFELVKKYIKGKLSLYSLIGYLEPFGIYLNDLTYKQYEEMNKYIATSIKQYKKDFAESFKTYRSVIPTGRNISKYGPTGKNNDILRILETSVSNEKQPKEIITDGYSLQENINSDILSNSEIIKYILDQDGGLLFMTAISLVNAHLLSAININDQIEEVDKEYKSAMEEEEKQNECKKYVMSKRYKALDEIQDDNGKEIYFDKKIDPTRYEVIEEYSDKRQALGKRDFKAFLIENLKANIGMSDEDALEEAEAMIEGKRVVREGHYAALEEEDQPVKYYERKDNKWIIDEKLPSVTVDDNELFCNIQSKCFSLKGDCIDKDLAESAIKHKSLDQILKEFDIKYEVSKETLITLLQNRLAYYSSYILKIDKIKEYNNFKYDKMYYKQGIEYTQEEALPVSPYKKYYDIIIGQTDFIKRMNDLYTLCNKFTREPIEGENKWFRYCTETSLPLVPIFQYEIANSWHWSGGDINDYNIVIAKIKKRQGKISDDGDSWVDEHSGAKICDISFDTEEGYEESGFKKISREILEAEIGSASTSSEAQKPESDPKSNDPDTRVCLIVINAMSKYMGLNIEDKNEFIISNVLITNSRALGSQSEYEAKAALLLKKRNKQLPPWETIKNQSLIVLTLSYMIIAIQISTPPIKTRKVFPGCIKSLEGYPLFDSSDLSTIEYISCIAAQISSSQDPWNTIKRLGKASIAKQVKSNIDKYALKNEEIRKLIKQKLEWLVLNKNNEIPMELDISNWQTFMPPLVPIELKTVQGISDGFKDKFLRNLRNGNKEQREQINVIKGKIIYFSSSFLKKVQDVISSKKALLTNSASEPFVENVCCQETANNTVVDYFIKQDKTIGGVDEQVVVLSNILTDVVDISKSLTILSLEDTRLIYPKLTNRFSEETIYLCFIKFCNYENEIPIPENLIPYCFDKPDEYDKFDDLNEKIRKLKRDGKNFNEGDHQSLLKVNSRRNMIELDFQQEEVSEVQKIRSLIETLDELESDEIPSALRQRLSQILDVFSVSIKEDPEELKSLTNYLHASNDAMRVEIKDFINRNARMKRSVKVSINNFIDNFAKFDNLRVDMDDGMFSTQDDESVYRAIQYVKNCTYELTKVYSNIVINECDYKKIDVPRYWKLSKRHEETVRKMVRDSYVTLGKFYKDPAMIQLLNKMQNNTVNLNLLMNELICFSSVEQDNGDTIYSVLNKNSVIKLIEFIFLSVIREHIVIINEIIVKIVKTPTDITQELASVEKQNALPSELVDELEIVSGETLDLSKKVSEYLLTIINIFINTKKEINYSYQDMMDLVNRAKEKEKDDITRKLKDLTDEERAIDTEFKKHKLGDWGLGLQKGLTQYVADFYDKEIEDNERQALRDRQLDNLGLTDDTERSFISAEMNNSDRIQQDIDREEYDLSMLPEDDDFGDNDDVQYGY